MCVKLLEVGALDKRESRDRNSERSVVRKSENGAHETDTPYRQTVMGTNRALIANVAFATQASPVPASNLRTPDTAVKRRFFDLETRETQMDATVWKTEVRSRRYEEVFIRLWDQLRLSEDPWKVIDEFPIGALVLGTPNQSATADHGISMAMSGAPFRHIDPSSWKTIVREWRDAGYRLEQSEWRHTRFEVSTNNTAESAIEMTLHVSNTSADARFVVQGTLKVSWRPEPEPGAVPSPAAIDATGLRIVSRLGAPIFDHVTAADFTPELPSAQALEPNLQVYDLDGDGLSEIVLVRQNRLFWNKGGGKFQLDDLFTHPLQNVRTGLIADFDGDGVTDFLAVNGDGLAMFQGDSKGRFLTVPRRSRVSVQELPNPFVMTAGDIDNDGDLDIWLAQYKVPYENGQIPTPYFDANDGYPSYLLINRGNGEFHDQTEMSGLAAKRFRRTYSASFADLDGDQDLDLLVTSDFAGVDLYLNDGKGVFSDATDRLLSETHCFGMAQTIGDFDLDGRLDFLVIGMNSPTADRLNAMNAGPVEPRTHLGMRSRMAYGNRLYLRGGTRFALTPLSDQVARSGWSWGAANGDFDNDGDLDIYVVNGHISGQSVRDYESHFWCHDIYVGDSNPDPALDLYFQSVQTKHRGAGDSFGGFEKNRLYLNQGGKSFVEAGFLMGVAMEEDCRNAIADDLDGDGKLDLLVTTFQVWPKPKQILHLFPNFCERSGNWIGFRLRESRPGFSPIGAKVIVTTSAGKQIRTFVTGDSYRSQHSTTAHFGIGNLEAIDTAEVVWPNGQATLVRNPAINQYHAVFP